jgi:hypothetical protein
MGILIFKMGELYGQTYVFALFNFIILPICSIILKLPLKGLKGLKVLLFCIDAVILMTDRVAPEQVTIFSHLLSNSERLEVLLNR